MRTSCCFWLVPALGLSASSALFGCAKAPLSLGEDESADGAEPSGVGASSSGGKAGGSNTGDGKAGGSSTGDGGTSMVDATITPDGTALGDLAATLGEREWVRVPANASLDALDIPDALLYWADSASWDPVNRTIEWVGSTGSCCGDGVFRLLTYTVATNTWEIANTPYSGSGHAYDGNAVDGATGMLYFGQYYSDTTHIWNGQDWSDTPEMSNAGVTPALAWFPELDEGNGGLVFVGDEGTLRWYDGSSWTELPHAQTGDYNTFAEYNPVHRVVWFGAGNGATTSHFRMGADFSVATLADAPFSLSVGAALHSVDPVTGAHIAVNLEAGTFWEFDIAGDTWAQITDMTGDVPTISNAVPTFQVPIPEYGAILFFTHNFDERNVYLYRHAP